MIFIFHLVGNFDDVSDCLSRCLTTYLRPTTKSTGAIAPVPDLEIRSCVSVILSSFEVIFEIVFIKFNFQFTGLFDPIIRGELSENGKSHSSNSVLMVSYNII